MLAIAQDLDAIDKDMRHARAVLMRIARQRVILHLRGIEYGDIGIIARLEVAAVAQLEVVRRQAREPPHSILEPDQPFIADIFADDAREAAISAGMGMITQESAFIGNRTGIRTEADPGQLDLFAQVVLGHAEVEREDAAVVLDEQVDEGVLRFFAALSRHLAQAHALIAAHFRLGETAEHDAIRAILLIHILPTLRWQQHIGFDAPARGRVFQPLDHTREAAIMRPGGNAGGQARAAVRVGIHIGSERQAILPRRLDALDDLVHLMPVGFARRFEMIDLARHAGRAHDLQQLVQGLVKCLAFAAQVRDVHAIVLGHHAAELDQLGGILVGGWRINQRGRHAHGALAHGFVQQALHLVHLAAAHGPVVIAGGMDAQGG